MALVETTLSSALGLTDTALKVASATSFAVGRVVQVGSEMMQVTKAYDGTSTTVPVSRGLDGSVQKAWPSSSRVVHGAAADFSAPAPGVSVSYPVAGRAREVKYYSAAGAISLPTPGSDMVAVICGTAIAMTLADPAKSNDGDMLIILQDTAAAHTVTNTTGFGGAGGSYDVLTSNGTGTAAVLLIALNERWHILPAVTGTLTNCAWALA